MLDSKALTKIQSIILIAVIAFAGVGGGVAYVLLSEEESFDAIKIGVLADLDGFHGKSVLQGAVLAAEQLNSEGGILGKQVEVIGEDNDVESGADMTVISSALTRLITFHKVDFVIGYVTSEAGLVCQEIVAEHKKIFIATAGSTETIPQQVLDNYEKYKYYFCHIHNVTSIFQGTTDSLLNIRENTGLNKVGYLGEDLDWTNGVMDGLDYVLPEVYGFETVYRGTFPLGTVDFSSYFAAAESAGVEILVPLVLGDEAISFVNEYYERQSPIMIYSGVLFKASLPESWEWTDGKCEHMCLVQGATVVGYPLTNKTLLTRQAYFARWGESIGLYGSYAYDILQFILSDAIERAGTIETEAVVSALERTSIETSNAQNFVFTPSHSVMMGENPNDPEADYLLVMMFQWQNGEQIPVHPKKIKEEAGATLTFPDWSGPWDDLD